MAKIPRTRVRVRASLTSDRLETVRRRKGLMKSFMMTEESELIPESRLDMAAARMAVINSPETPSGRAWIM